VGANLGSGGCSRGGVNSCMVGNRAAVRYDGVDGLVLRKIVGV
jgi:hypothetical protein